jgi:hypothetical protein
MLFSTLFVLTSTRAFDQEPLERINHLNLSQLVYNEEFEGSARTETSIILKPHTTYTLVMSQDFLGQAWDHIDQRYIEIEEWSGSKYYLDLLSIDMTHGRAYFTFDTQEGLIDLLDIPVKGEANYDIILYEGTYADFPGFIPYVDADDPLEYFGVLPIDYDTQPTLETITSYVIAKDPFGGTISSTLIFDDYTISNKLPGTYQMVFEADYNDISKRYYLDVKVMDITAPTLSIDGTLEIPFKEKWTIDDIKKEVVIHDNVDALSWTDLVVTNDTYTDAESLGNYQMSFSVTDSSGNTNTIDVSITLVDQQGPKITGPSSIYLYTSDASLSNADIQSKLTFEDDIDGTNVTISIIANEYQQTSTPGKYKITFKAVDQAQNVSLFYVFIHVIENRGPVFEHNELVIEKTTADAMTDQDVIDWLKEQLELSGIQATNITVLYNEYETHEHEKGSYYVYMSYKVDGQDMTSRVRIDVEQKPVNVLWVILPASGLLIAGTTAFIVLRHKKVKY